MSFNTKCLWLPFLLLCHASENAFLARAEFRKEAQVSDLEEQLRLMKAKLAASDKDLANAKLQLADKDRKIAEPMEHIADLTKALNTNAGISKPLMPDNSEALKLIEQIKGTMSRKVLEVPLDHVTEGTAAESTNTSVGLMFEQRGGKTLVVNTLVGSPAFGCNKLHAGDEVRVHVCESELASALCEDALLTCVCQASLQNLGVFQCNT